MQAGCRGNGKLWERFSLFGMLGLTDFRIQTQEDDYVVQIYQAPAPAWCGRRDPQEEALREVLRLLISKVLVSAAGHFPGEDHESSTVCAGFQPTPREKGDDCFSSRGPAPLRQRASLFDSRQRLPRQGSVPASLVIYEPEAEVVRNIFFWHAYEGMSIRQIVKRLTNEGYTTPKGRRRWAESTVHKIVRQEAYVGTLYYNRSYEITVTSPEGVP